MEKKWVEWRKWANWESPMDSQRMTDSGDDSSAVIVHIFKSYPSIPGYQREREVGEKEGESEGEGRRRRFLKKMSEKISSSSFGKKYKSKTHRHRPLFFFFSSSSFFLLFSQQTITLEGEKTIEALKMKWKVQIDARTHVRTHTFYN